MHSMIKNKYFLYLTEFFSGMSVMAVELGASRLLAPYFSSSQIVWTVIIGAIMIAMALGNLWGGRLADRNPDPGRLYRRLAIAAVWIALIPFAGKFVIAGISVALALVVKQYFLVWASLASCLALFVFPLMLLGTVTPSLVKLAVQDLDKNGETVGRLGALNTIGSIIGTFLPTFVTIPSVGTSATFLIFAGILLLLSAVYFFSEKRGRGACGAAFLLLAALGLLCRKDSFAFWEDQIVYEGESIYNYLQVKETEDSIILSTNVLAGVQSMKPKDGDLTGMYYDYAMAAPFMAGVSQKSDAKILVLGLGTGTFATMCAEFFPEAELEGVEIDEKIAKLARRYFDMPASVKVSVDDGRAYLERAGSYDVIMVDAYQDITIPFQMSSVEFFTMVKEHLTPNGVMVVNLNMTSDGEGSINEYLCDTIRSVFPEVYTADVWGGTNTELFASAEPGICASLPAMVKVYETQRSAAAADKRADDGGEASQKERVALCQRMEQVAKDLVLVEPGRHILTDDKAPVEVLGMKAIDEIIGSELSSLQDMFQKGNLKTLLREFR